MLFIHYLNELKYRILYCFFSFFINFLVLFFYLKELLFIVVTPLVNINRNDSFSYFIFTDMLDIFFIYIKIILVLGFVTIFPLVLIQLWFFLVEGLYNYEKIFLLKFLIFFIIFLINIYFFLYTYLIPLIWLFFINFELTTDNSLFGIYYEAHISDYVNLMLYIFYIFFCLILIPVLMIFLLYFNFVEVNFFMLYRKYLIIIFFILGGILSPSDIFSQIIISFFIFFIYEIVIFFSLLVQNYIKCV